MQSIGTPARLETPIQEPQELLPNRRPNTEDFLTFLCFRSSQMLPSHLDFFNTNKRPADNADNKPSSSTNLTASSSGTSKPIVETSAKRTETAKKIVDVPEPIPADVGKPNYIPFAVRKHADTVAIGTRRQNAHPQKKRAVEQQTQQRGTNGQTRNKTRLSTKDSQMSDEVEHEKVADKSQNDKSLNDKSLNDKSLNESKSSAANASFKDMKNKRKLRSSLIESSGSNKEDGVEPEKDSAAPKNDKVVKKMTRKSKQVEEAVESMPDTDERPEKKIRKEASVVPENEQHTTKNTKTNIAAKGQKDEVPSKKDITTVKKDESVAKQDDKSNQAPLRMTRLKSIYSPRQENDESPSEKSGRKNARNKKSSQDFSSDDEKQVTKSVDKPALSKKVLKRQSIPKSRNSNSNDAHPHSADQKSENSSQESEPLAKKRFSGRKNSAKTTDSKAKTSEKDKGDFMSGNDSQDDTDKTIKVRKKRRNEFTDLSQTDQSENEIRSGRPMRKTKEAAAIYMELIGQKLNLGDFDDDNYSLDSFPELPNVKKTEQMENEIRANAAKEKKEVKPSSRGRRKTDDKKNPEIVEEKKVPPKKEKAGTKTAAATVVNENGTVKNKLGKSFSDSDDEPLAVKCTTKSKKQPIRKELKITDKPAEKLLKTETIPKNSKVDNAGVVKPSEAVPVTQHIPKVEQPKVLANDSRTKVVTTDIELGDAKFKVPAESVTQLLSPPIHMNTPKPMMKDVGVVKTPKGSSKELSKNSTQSISAILADLMPSKEESGKIFGIASVTLAQSSGPNDTKCTLGKCGSIHRPSLGPVVPTETYLTEQLSSKERRKAKVNMTHEQIEKWLNECSKHVNLQQTDELEDFDMTMPIKPIDYSNIRPPSVIERGCAMFDRSSSANSKSSSSPKEKESEKDISEPPTRAVTPKMKPGALIDDVEIDKGGKLTPTQMTKQSKTDKKVTESSANTKKSSSSPIVIKEAILKSKPVAVASTTKTAKQSITCGTSTKAKVKSPINTIDLTKSPSAEKKPIYNRRTPVYNTKVAQTSKEKTSKAQNAFGAFSPDNEASVYSFDKEEDVMQASTPYRRHSLRDSNQLDEDKSKSAKSTDEKISPVKKTQQASVEESKTPAASNKKTAAENKKSATEKKKSAVESKKVAEPIIEKCENSKLKQLSDKITAQGGILSKELDSDGHTFYIPLQCAPSTSGSTDQVIQGVAVKLGTEGPEGPNQKVTMHAKLVTKSKMGMNTTPLPEGFGNVNDLLMSLMDNKDSALKSISLGAMPHRQLDNKQVPTPFSSPASVNDSQLQSNNSMQSPKAKAANQRQATPRVEGTIKPCNKTSFPNDDDAARLVEAPIFRPTEKEFQDPVDYIQKITPIAASFGLCRIIPPSTFKPECKISDDMRFTAYNQYVHKMLHRWGSNVKELSAIKKYLATQSITLKQPPWIGGMEVDLPRLYHTVQDLGGLSEVIEKKKWARVAEDMCIPKTAQDRVTKLDDIYCKYLLPYETLSHAERQKLFDEVEADWAKAETKARRNAERSVLSDSSTNQEESNEDDEESEDDDEGMECIIKGKSMALNAFFRIARNTMALWFKNSEPSTAEIESEFWRHVAVRDSHVCVHSGSIDSSGWGYGFPSPGPKSKGSPCAKHPWNLKVLTNNNGSILRSIGPVAGVTVPTLHVGMLFSACCWYRDPHGLPWIEYLHTGGSKIWYGVPDEQSANFRSAFTKLLPIHCQNKTVWLPCDTAMVPPHMLTEEGVSLCRTEQEPGQFVVVFPRAYTSSVCTSYTISESVYFATVSWLDSAKDDFKVN